MSNTSFWWKPVILYVEYAISNEEQTKTTSNYPSFPWYRIQHSVHWCSVSDGEEQQHWVDWSGVEDELYKKTNYTLSHQYCEEGLIIVLTYVQV